MRSVLASLALWMLGAVAAWAQDADTPLPPPLSAAEVRAALVGRDLAGEVLGTGQPWSECIDPAGRTWWRTGDFTSNGRLEVREDGQACFRYSHTGYRREVCWAMRRVAGQLRFDLVNGKSFPVVVLQSRPVRACGGDAPIS